MTAELTDFAWLQELYELSQMAASDRDGEAVLLEMVRHIADGFSAGSATLATYSEDGPCLRIVAATHLPPDAMGARIALGEGIFGSVARDRKPLLINGMVHPPAAPSSHPPAAPAAPTASQELRRPPHSSMVWPLQLKMRLVAVLAVNRQEHHKPFDERDLQRGSIMGSMLALVIENSRMHGEQQRRIATLSQLNADLAAVNDRLSRTQDQLRQSEKMASLGQLAAGVAHEINNPIGYVYSNIGALEGYVNQLIARIRTMGRMPPGEHADADAAPDAAPDDDLAYLLEDVPQLMSETREGLVRVTKIVQDLKDFSRVDAAEQWELADLNAGIRSTLNIVNNEIRYKVTVRLELGDLPLVECLPSQVNQVVLNLLVNASHAVEQGGLLRVRSGVDAQQVWFEVEDDGCGIAPEVQARIFEPFFTTKPVGKGTGLGLSLSYSIVQKHHGRIELTSQPGVGSTFRVVLPVAQSVALAERRHAHA